MSILVQTANDTIAEAGLNYFISLYGFPPGHLGNNLKQVALENPLIIDDDIHGWITWNDERIPVLQKPTDLTNQGNVMLTYTDGTVAYPCAVICNDDIKISLDIFTHLGLFVSGYLEKIWNNLKDEKKELIAIPLADYYCDFLFSCIRIAHEKAGAPLVHKSFWPDGHSCAVCLTHDVDEVKKTYQWVTYPIKLIKRGKLRNLILQCRSLIQKIKGNEPYWTFNEILRVESLKGVRSSFYFLKERGKVRIFDKNTWRHYGRRYDFNSSPVRKLIHDLNSHGWEVGLHGSFYSYTNPEMLRNEKDALEHSLGSIVVGGRQHNLNLSIPETWLHQEKAGLLYDTTLGYNDCLGFRWGISFPFRPFLPEEDRDLDVLQIPLAIEDLPYFRFQEPFDQFVKIFDRINNIHGCLTLLWHHSVFNENEFPGWESDYVKILDYCKGHDAWIGNGRKIQEWWTQREDSTIDWEYSHEILKIAASPKGIHHFITIYLPDHLKVKEVNNASIISSGKNLCEIKTHGSVENNGIEILLSNR